MRNRILGLAVVALVAVGCDTGGPSSPIAPSWQIMGDVPTVVDAIGYDADNELLLVDFRIVEGLYTAAKQDGVDLSIVIDLTLSDGSSTWVTEPCENPLIDLKAFGPAVEGRLSFRTSTSWDGKDGQGNSPTGPVTAYYNARVVNSLPSGREVMLGTSTTGSLIVQ